MALTYVPEKRMIVGTVLITRKEYLRLSKLPNIIYCEKVDNNKWDNLNNKKNIVSVLINL